MLADVDALADSVVDSVVDWVVEVVPSTVLPCCTRASLESSDAVATSEPFSSALAVFATVAAPRTAPAATIPLSKPRLVISVADTSSSRTSATTVSSTWPRMTFKRPKLEVAARNQFLPDLINLKRVTRSVSRNSPFERLKNISVSLIHFLFPLYYRLLFKYFKQLFSIISIFLKKFFFIWRNPFSYVFFVELGHFFKKFYTIKLWINKQKPHVNEVFASYLIFSNMLSMCWMDFSRPSK